MSTTTKNEFKKNKKTTFIWEPNSDNYGSSKRILTHVFIGHYNGVFGFRDAMIGYENNIEFNLDYRCSRL
jgi:hypothetical protein